MPDSSMWRAAGRPIEIMPDSEPHPTPDDPGITVPMPSPSAVPAPASSRPSASSYAAELPLPEELQAMLGTGYVVESFLGQGGMGAVYKGLQMPLRRPVAIKILAKRETASGGEDEYAFEERFKREAYAMATLTHPNIVQVYDCGDAGENYLYISMELVEGGDLSDAIKGGQCTPEVALKLIPQICDGLQAAHERGLVHRDIKPANIFLTKDGRPKVADFGLAKKFDSQSTFATKTGMAMGTPDYAAPEQYDAVKDIDHRADVYSLGVMMYQMLTGTLPRGAYRPPSQRAAVDPRLDDVVFRAMEHDRNERYQSVAEIKAALVEITRPAPVAAATRPAPGASAGATPRTSASVVRPAQTVARSTAPPASRPAPAPPPKKSSAVGILAIGGACAALVVGAWMMLKPKPSAVSPAAAAAEPTPAAPPADEGATWTDALAEWKRNSGGMLPSHARAEGSGLRVVERKGVGDSPRPFQDVAVRASARAESPSSRWEILLRRGPGSTLGDVYTASLLREGTVHLSKTTGGRRQGLASKKLPADFSIEREHTMEFRAEGDLLTVVVDGTQMLSVRDGTHRSGKFLLLGDPGTVFVKAEYRELSSRARPIPTVLATAPLKPGAIKLWDTPEKVAVAKRGAWVDGAVKLHDGGLFYFDSPSRDAILRASIRMNPDAESPRIRLRMQGTTVADAFYKLGLGSRSKVELYYGENNGQTLLGSWPLPRAYGPDEWLRLELHAIGENFTVYLDGQQLGTATHAGLMKPGGAGISAKANAYFRDVVYVPLDHAGRTTPAASGPSAATATKGAPFVNILGMKFVPAPITGGPTNGQRVLFSIWETRVQDMEAFERDTGKSRKKAEYAQGPTHPATHVSWDHANAFCAWLTEKEQKSGKIGVDLSYRLPSDEEWSDAVGQPGEYPWGDAWPPPAGKGNYAGDELRRIQGAPNNGHLAWIPILDGYEDDFPTTAPVGSFPANENGLFDLGGNAWEWCDARSKDGQAHLLRGSSWNDSKKENMTTGVRVYRKDTVESPSHGFRVVLAPVSAAPRSNAAATK